MTLRPFTNVIILIKRALYGFTRFLCERINIHIASIKFLARKIYVVPQINFLPVEFIEIDTRSVRTRYAIFLFLIRCTYVSCCNPHFGIVHIFVRAILTPYVCEFLLLEIHLRRRYYIIAFDT